MYIINELNGLSYMSLVYLKPKVLYLGSPSSKSFTFLPCGLRFRFLLDIKSWHCLFWHMYLPMHLYMHMFCIKIFQIHKYICVYVYVYIHTYTYIYIYIYIHIYIYIYICLLYVRVLNTIAERLYQYMLDE